MVENPILKSAKNIVFYFTFWLIIIILYFALLYYQMNISLMVAILDSIIFNLILSGLGLSFWYTANFMPVENNKTRKIIITHLLAGLIAATFWLSSGYFIISGILGFKHHYGTFFVSTLAWRFVIGAMFYYLIIAFYYLLLYNKNLQEKISQEAALKNLVTETEIKSLKFQINPHFIFNSLNSMSALTTIAPERARDMILKLADFLRYTLATNNKKTNTVKEELRNINLYLEIEKIRFEDKFEYIEDIQPGCMEFQIPAMILQPLFENAIKHAVYESLEKVTLKLHCKKEEQYLQLILENNYEDGSQNKKGAGIGLQNIKNRLELLYNQDNLIRVEKNNNIFLVKLFIPVEEKLEIANNKTEFSI